MSPIRNSFTVKSDRIVYKLVTPSWVSAAWALEGSTPEPPRNQYYSLWDTGATGSMITERVAEDLGLEIESYTKIYHAGGEAEDVPVYYVNLVLLNNVQIAGVRVSQVKLIDSDVLIGMDIINRGDFAVSNRNGETRFSFRIPSVEKFDFVPIDDKYNRKRSKSGKRRSSKRHRGK